MSKPVNLSLTLVPGLTSTLTHFPEPIQYCCVPQSVYAPVLSRRSS